MIDLHWWWGYLHKDGTYRVGPYISVDEIIRASQHPSAIETTGPFLADSNETAMEKIKTIIIKTT